MWAKNDIIHPNQMKKCFSCKAQWKTSYIKYILAVSKSVVFRPHLNEIPKMRNLMILDFSMWFQSSLLMTFTLLGPRYAIPSCNWERDSVLSWKKRMKWSENMKMRWKCNANIICLKEPKKYCLYIFGLWCSLTVVYSIFDIFSYMETIFCILYVKSFISWK